MAELAKLPNVIGVKDATGNLARVSAQRAACGADFIQLSGNDDMALGFNAMGGVGAISVTANVAPQLCAQFQAATLAGDFRTALALQDRLYPLHAALFSDASPGPTKYALAQLGTHGSRDVRLPICEPSAASKAAVDAALAPCRAHLMARPRHETDKVKTVAENRRARFEYSIEDVFEAGIALTGTEVKSLRFGEGTIAESYAEVKDGEVWLVNANIPEFSHGNRFNHEPKRPRKLLLHEREIDKLGAAVARQGMTLVPLSIYFNDRGRAKVELALGKGKKLHDKRETERTATGSASGADHAGARVMSDERSRSRHSRTSWSPSNRPGRAPAGC